MHGSTIQHFMLRSATNKRRLHAVPLPPSDIDACIQFSKLRCVLCIFSMLLVCSDIPRTGLGIKKLSDIIPTTEPSSGIFFGPHSIPIATIIKVPNPATANASSMFIGSCGDSAIMNINVWAHKKSTLSIAMRGLVKVLRIEATWPRCLLYLTRCTSVNVDLQSAFGFLDSVVSAAHSQLFPNQSVDTTSRPFVYLTVNRWIDRLHHYLLMLVGWARQQSRINSVHYYPVSKAAPLSVCNHNVPRINRPVICDNEIAWMCDPPLASTASTRIPVWKHLQIRLLQLQQQHPRLQFDVTLFSSLWQRSNIDDPALVRWMFYRVGQFDITIVIRGRDCTTTTDIRMEADCETVLVDDFRHERTTLVTDLDQWYPVVTSLRVFSQGYMFLRILALWIGCYLARSSETKLMHAPFLHRFGYAWATFFRIPGQVIVYSCWLPALLYAIAHLMDSAIVHMYAEFAGSSVNGKYKFSLYTNLKVAAVQMRNIWGIAVFTKVLSLVQTRLVPFPWRRNFGLWSIRGGWVGWISAITILAPLQTIQHRDSRILHVKRHSTQAVSPLAHLMLQSEFRSDVGAKLDVKTIAEAVSLVIIFIATAKLSAWILHRCFFGTRAALFASSICINRSHYLPYSVDTLFNSSYLSFYWRIEITASNQIRRTDFNSVFSSSAVTVVPLTDSRSKAVGHKRAPILSVSHSSCATCFHGKAYWGWPSSQGCPHHDGIYNIESRSKAVWSVVRLINLAMLTDPLILIRLYFFGQPLYLYSISNAFRNPNIVKDASNHLVILPCSPNQIASELGTDECHYELFDRVDSALVPWTLLLQCG